MTVNSKIFYKDYIYNLENEINTIKIVISSLKRVKKIIINKLKSNEENILTLTNCSLDDIKNSIKLKISSLESSVQFFRVPKDGLSKSKLLVELKKLIELNKLIDKRDKKLNKLKNEIISYKIYKDVISIFNKSLIDEILKGEHINLGFGVGTIKIKKRKRDLSRPVIDWGETNKLKEEIINNGGTLYKVLKRDKDNNILEDNNGEKYLVYRTDEYYYMWHWKKSHCTLPNFELYSFAPTTGDNGNIKRLAKYRKENEYADLKYN